MSPNEARVVARLAMGRILLLGSRPTRPRDVEQYEAARLAFLEAAAVLGLSANQWLPDWARDRNGGSGI